MNRIFTLLTCTILSLITHSAVAQTTNIYIKALDANGVLIQGGAQNARHANEIDATGLGQDNTGCSNNLPGGPGACGGKLGNFIFNMPINQSLPILDKQLFMGTALKSVDIVFERAGGTAQPIQYYKIHLETVFVTHITNSGDNSSAPTVQVELAAGKAQWTYTPQSPSGQAGTPVSFGWDAIHNTSF